MLVALIRSPIKYNVRKVGGPGTTGELTIQDGTTNRKRLYSPPPTPSFMMGPNDYLSTDASGLPVITRYLGLHESGAFKTGTNSDAKALAMLGMAPITPAQTANLAGVLNHAGLSPAMAQQLSSQLNANANKAVSIVGAPNAPIMASEWYNESIQIPIGEMLRESQVAAQVAEAQLEGDLQAIQNYNAAIRDSNQRPRQILSEAIGNDLGDDRAAWTKWLTDLFGYAYAPMQSADSQTTIVEQVPLAYQPQATPFVVNQVVSVQLLHHSCFGAGTPVRMFDGQRPIESLRVGDLVLTQDTHTGLLRYQAVVEVYHNPPNATYRIGLDGGESIVATGIHRLWKAGKGWTMARDLKPGDTLRTLGGLARVESVDAEERQPVYNLQVAEGESYFVGKTGVLAHDNSTINPVAEPFDAVGLPGAGPGSSSPQPRRQSMLGR